MSELTDRLKHNRARMEKLYDPKNAFGNQELLELQQEIDEDQKVIDNSITCSKCDGEGTVWHECDCGACDLDTEGCPQCGGEGYLPKSKKKKQ